MARSNKNYEAKRTDLVKGIWEIFMCRGYENTTLSLIIQELNISKGAFYHYFPTKEACADAAVDAFAGACREKIAGQLDTNGSALVHFQNLIISCARLFSENEKSIENINTPSNAVFHQKLMAALVKNLAPLYAQVIAQGVEEKVFRTEFPLETAQMILTLSNFYFDADLFKWEPQEMPAKLLAFEALLTLALGAEPGSFSFLRHL